MCSSATHILHRTSNMSLAAVQHMWALSIGHELRGSATHMVTERRSRTSEPQLVDYMCGCDRLKAQTRQRYAVREARPPATHLPACNRNAVSRGSLYERRIHRTNTTSTQQTGSARAPPLPHYFVRGEEVLHMLSNTECDTLGSDATFDV